MEHITKRDALSNALDAIFGLIALGEECDDFETSLNEFGYYIVKEDGKNLNENAQKAALYYKAALLHERPPFVPCRVRLLKQVTSDPSPFSEQITAPPGEYYVCSNKFGAIWIEEFHLVLKPGEFDVIEWTENVK